MARRLSEQENFLHKQIEEAEIKAEEVERMKRERT